MKWRLFELPNDIARQWRKKMTCSKLVELEQIQVRIEIFQKEIQSFFSTLKKLQEEDKLSDPSVVSLVNKRAGEFKSEFMELEKRFQCYLRRPAKP